MKDGGIDEYCFHLAVESSPAAMIMTDSEGMVRFANGESERMFGYPKEELIGRSIDLLVLPAVDEAIAIAAWNLDRPLIVEVQ